MGKGAYGAVYKGQHRSTGHIVALKIINLDTEDDDVGDIQKEISLLQQLMRSAKDGILPNVIKYYGSLMDGPRVWIIMELAEGGSIRTLVSPYQAIADSVPCPTPQRTTYLPHHAGNSDRPQLSAQAWRHPPRS